MARRKPLTVTVPTTFVGTFYDTTAGVYVATRKDGSLTVGRINKRGINVQHASVLPDSLAIATVEH